MKKLTQFFSACQDFRNRTAVRSFGWYGFFILAILINIFIFKNAWRVSKWVSITDQPPRLYSTFQYPTLQFPSNAPYGAGGKCGLDYGCLYFSAKNYLAKSEMYSSSADPFGRPAVTFPPFLIFLVAKTLAYFDFPISVLLSNFIQIIFFLVAAHSFFRNGSVTWRARIGGFTAFGFLLFCTPIGLIWFERAQTELFVAIASLLFVKAMRDGFTSNFMGAGIVGNFKWTFFPFFTLASFPYLFLNSNDRLKKLLLLGSVVAVPVLLIIPFGPTALNYLDLILHWEKDQAPQFLSLGIYFPLWVSKVIPFLFPVFFTGLAPIWRTGGDGYRSFLEILFWGTAGFLSASFGTFAVEYKLINLLFLLPLIIDGRSILFAQQKMKLTVASRLLGVLILIYAFRVKTSFEWLNQAVAFHRGLMPLIIATTVIFSTTLYLSISRKFKWSQSPQIGKQLTPGLEYDMITSSRATPSTEPK